MSKESRTFDLKECIVDFVGRTIHIAASLPETNAGKHHS
jgi:hypothetical protein